MESLRIKMFTLGKMRTNCYVVTNESESLSIVVDPGDAIEPVIDFLKKKRSITFY